MADFSLTTLFVVPVGNTLPSSGSTQNLTAGQFGLFLNTYAVATTGNISATGNITGNYYIGNGSLLTGITTTYGNDSH